MIKKNLYVVTALFVMVCMFLSACNAPTNEDAVKALALNKKKDANIEMYTRVWNEIINKRKPYAFNDSNFTKNVVMHVSPKDAVGIDRARIYYANYLTGFSAISFTIKDVFAQGEKLVKHWNFKGKHTGLFLGIPATGQAVAIDGVTLVRMENGKMAEEQDLPDNLELMQQLGLILR